MSGVGFSETRFEHLRKLVAVRDRRISTALLTSIGRLMDAAISGDLCDAARWLLNSRLIFLRKKNGSVPRPIRVGEVWCRVIAKRLVHDNRSKVQSLCPAARQFGVAVPGGTEGLIHFRTSIEQHISRSSPVLAMIDVDFQNAFPSVEWDSIRSVVGKQFPAVSGWARWCHASESQIILPSGARVQSDRGVEQGDPLGPVYCALVIAEVCTRVRERLLDRHIDFEDVWFFGLQSVDVSSG